MKKLNRREKTYVRLAIAAIVLALLVQGADTFFASRDELALENEAQQNRISNLQKKLENESAARYEAEAEALVESLKDAQERVFELRSESEATSFLSKVISTRAEKAGVNINSISNRKSKLISEEKELYELRTYFGYDCDLQALLTFFTMLDDQDFYLSVDNINISVRRQPKRKVKRRNKRITTRKPLNGNAVLTTLFHPNPDATPERYELKLAESDRMMAAAGLIAEEGDHEGEEDPTNSAVEAPTIKKSATRLPGKTTTTKKTSTPLVRPQLDFGRRPETKTESTAKALNEDEAEELGEDEADELDEEEEEVTAAPPKRTSGGLRPNRPTVESDEKAAPADTARPKPRSNGGWPKPLDRKPRKLTGSTKMGH